MFCGMVDGLAFLPKDSINLEMDCLDEIVPFELTELLDYFYETYVSGPCRIIPKAEIAQKCLRGIGDIQFVLRKWQISSVIETFIMKFINCIICIL